MGERAAQEAARNEKAFRSSVRETASTGGVADELGKLTEMRDSGQLTPDEYEQAKQRVLGVVPATTSTGAHTTGTVPSNLPA
jgi:hypothetical protein